MATTELIFDWKQDNNVLYKGFLFRTDWKTESAYSGLWFAETFSEVEDF